jgi:hypothetical protein
MALRNLAVDKEAKVPESFLHDLSMILECGYVSRPQPTITRKLEKIERDKLNLPKFKEADERFKATFMKALEAKAEAETKK